MDLKKILAISGKPGLYVLVAQTKSGALVESLIDKKRIPAFATDRISSLEEISIFTTDEETPLKEVFKTIYQKENGGACPIDSKTDNNKLKSYFAEVLPDYDAERVYVSDMKKVFNWYNLLQTQGLIDLVEETEEATSESEK
jgi:hypothetical protein